MVATWSGVGAVSPNATIDTGRLGVKIPTTAITSITYYDYYVCVDAVGPKRIRSTTAEFRML